MSANERTPTRDELLAMAYVDNELEDTARREFEARLAKEPALSKEVAELQKLEVMARNAVPPEPMDYEWKRLEQELAHSVGNPIGWIALCIGSVGLFGWVFYELVRSEMELLPKVLILSILGGLTILLALTARARLRTLPYDPYRSIQR